MFLSKLATIETRLNRRRRDARMTYSALAERCGIAEVTVKRILGGHLAKASFENVAAIAGALGVSFEIGEEDVEAMRRTQARRKAEQVARMVQGTSGLESQAVDEKTYQLLVERSYHELLAGPSRRLWSS